MLLDVSRSQPHALSLKPVLQAYFILILTPIIQFYPSIHNINKVVLTINYKKMYAITKFFI